MMKQRNLIFGLVLVTLLMACSGSQRPTPTPFAEADGTAAAASSATPPNITIADLAADPEAYASSFVTLTGQYRRLPLLVCSTDPHPSPATWQLEGEDGSLIAVGGFDAQVRSLLPTSLTMTVAGVWQMFEGPVGCGKSATTRQVWYLKASDIVSPSPIARVTLTPTGSGTQIAAGDGGTAVATPGDDSQLPTPTLEFTEGEPTLTPTSASTTIPAPPGGGTPGGTPTTAVLTPTVSNGTAVGSPSPTTDALGTPSPGGSPGPSPTAGSGTPTATGSGGAAAGTPTVTPQVFTTATRNPNDFDVIEFDELAGETPVLELLGQEEAHLWPILFDYDGVITVTAIAEATMNLVLEIVGPNKDVVQQANNTGNGGLETIAGVPLNVALGYQIRIYNLNATEGDYCLIFNEEGGFPDTIKGRIEYGQTVTNRVAVLGIDYWCFLGHSGDTVNISTAATGSEGDLVLGLFGPPQFTAIGAVFQDAEIENVTLTQRGLHLIGVLDFDAAASGYTLTLTKN
ncbi:MAG: hypothetical protein IPM53_32850 [Anaerolineaceae bacterium]|nr:hypothetical protein [Anaerolineaceae bacterium]